VDIQINRTEGTDGAISCQIRTEALIIGQQYSKSSENAKPHLDYTPIDQRIEFAAGES
jgi:hypothetical protein